jgi:raffinose/stachyose/melibiose transport system permease protein
MIKITHDKQQDRFYEGEVRLATKKWRDIYHSIFFIAPAYILFTTMLTIPLLLSFYYALTDWNGATEANWVGLQNFVRAFTDDPSFANSFWFTARYAFICLILSNIIGIIFALALTTQIRSKNILRTVFFMPNLIGGIILGFIWQFVFTKAVPSIGSATNIGLFNLPWLGDAPTAFWATVIVFVWQMGGYLMVIYIAAIEGVDRSLYESSQIDGANLLQVITKITLPLIAPAFTICIFLSLAWGFKTFDSIYSLTKGGPFGSTESVTINIYEEAFLRNNAGFGTAKALIFFAVIVAVTLIQVAISKRREVQM